LEEDLLEDAYLAEYTDILHSIPVELPSTYTAEIRSHPAMVSAVSIERKLREGQANDALNELRAHLTALYSLEDLQKQGSGQAHGKRVRAMAATEVTIGHHARDEYRRVRNILLKLGMPEGDETYRPLTDNDARPFIVFSHQHQRGDSKRPPSWIWNDFSFLTNQQDAEVKDYMWQKLRPFWFRRRAARARWQEEVYMKREEMYRTQKFFEWHRARWTERAQDAEEEGQYSMLMYICRQSHRYSRLLQGTRCFPNDIDKVCAYWRALQTLLLTGAIERRFDIATWVNDARRAQAQRIVGSVLGEIKGRRSSVRGGHIGVVAR
ncbi:hypothetical protein C8Q73DRAFT_661332, partial [Cubamyces lactineus]